MDTNYTESPGRPRTMRGVDAIAAYCGPGISHHQVRAAIRNGDIRRLGSGRYYAVLTADVDAWLDRIAQDGAA